MSNIIQLIQHPCVGGLEKMAFGLCNSKLADAKMFLVALEGRKKSAIKAWPQLGELSNFYCLNKPAGVSFEVVKKLALLIDRHNIQVIHSHHIGPMLYASLVKLIRPRVKHIHTIHDAWYLNDFKQRTFTKLINKFTPVTIVADAQAVAKTVKSAAQIRSDHVVLNGIDTEYFTPSSRYLARSKLALPQNQILVGCAARVEHGKGHKAMIRSLQELPSQVHIAFAGSGSKQDEMQSYAKQLGVSNRVHWLGCVASMPTFYSAIDVFCLYSEREGLPLSILEALSCNRPVVASDVGGIKEVLNDKLGIMLSLNEEHLLARSLMQAMKFNYGMNIRQHALSHSNLNVMASRYNKIYQQVTM